MRRKEQIRSKRGRINEERWEMALKKKKGGGKERMEDREMSPRLSCREGRRRDVDTKERAEVGVRACV